VQWIGSSGERARGAAAVGHVLTHARGVRWFGWLLRAPIARSMGDLVYRVVANHRTAFGRIDRWLTGARPRPARHARIRQIFFVALGASFYAAFASMRRQVLGLYGANGILPIDERLAHARTLGNRALRDVPTIFLHDASDRALLDATRHGERLSIALMLGIEPRLTALALWAYYLSFVTAGGEFLGFQWDALLLESALHAAVIAPPASRSRRHEEPTALQVALMRWLVFRLHFESGLVKYRSPDASWRGRNALCHYYETAPLPTRYGWYAHHLPLRFQRFSTRAALWIELAAPFLAFGPRRARIIGFAALTGLQSLIALTGNYGFFNLLTIALNLWLLDDGVFFRDRRTIEMPTTARAITLDTVSTALGALGGISFVATHVARFDLPHWGWRTMSEIAPFRSVNTYGPFSVMTTTRPEIVVEGSNDAEHWVQYPFAYKIDEPARAPRWVAPHQPRLDWQMWFAALGGVPTWFVRFVQRLLEGSADVISLLARNPFPDGPPRYIRARLEDYRMTSLTTRRETGLWWEREPLESYLPAVTLGPASRASRASRDAVGRDPVRHP
jgi:hypothetical protein